MWADLPTLIPPTIAALIGAAALWWLDRQAKKELLDDELPEPKQMRQPDEWRSTFRGGGCE